MKRPNPLAVPPAQLPPNANGGRHSRANSHSQDGSPGWPAGTPHNFHVHDAQFQVLTVDGGPPPPALSRWKDTIYLPPQRPIRIVLRFTGHTDPNMPYMYHCHLLWHEDTGMMGQFVVVEPGQSPGRPPGHGTHGPHG